MMKGITRKYIDSTDIILKIYTTHLTFVLIGIVLSFVELNPFHQHRVFVTRYYSLRTCF